MPTLSPWSILAVAAAPLVAACSGSSQTTADAYWSFSPLEEQQSSRPVRETEEIGRPPPEAQPLTEGAAEGRSPWVGVRHDLMLAPSPNRKERCACLAVEVGEPKDPRFQWVAGAPEGTFDLMVVALSARGVSCPGGNPDEEKRRPSISAVDQEGNDIIIEVEELPDGRPLATGAVIPKLSSGGAIYVKPRSAVVPYGRMQGGGRCQVSR